MLMLSSVRATSLHDFEARDIDGNMVDLAQFAGRVLVLVNVACE